jgi:tetratricopeptide (TPR) repeat protein
MRAASAQPMWRLVIAVLVSAGCATSPQRHLDAAAPLIDQARYAEAEPLLVAALKEAETSGVRANVGVALYNLGGLHYNQGRYAEAASEFQRALAIYGEVGTQAGVDARRIQIERAKALFELGAVRTAQGRYEDGERVLGQAMAIVEAAGGAESLAGSLYYSYLGKLKIRQGRYDEAGALVIRALEIREQRLRNQPAYSNEEQVAYSLNDLGRIKRAQGKWVEAEPLVRRALDIFERRPVPDHPVVAECLTNLGAVYAAQARYAEAEVLYRRALRIQETTLPKDHPDIAASLEGYATLLRQTNRETEAIKLETRAKAIRTLRSQPAS